MAVVAFESFCQTQQQQQRSSRLSNFEEATAATDKTEFFTFVGIIIIPLQ